MKQIAIIIPTWNNHQYLESCLKSLLNTNIANLFHIYVVNNGHPNSCDFIERDHHLITVLQTNGENLGWEGGLKLGVEKSKEPYILFLNDDTYFPQSSIWWAHQLLSDLSRPEIGAVGPSTNVVMGSQNIFIPITTPLIEVNMLIGFCILIKRKVLEEAGGIDDSLPGGDDLDISIRIRKAGYKLLADRRVFIYHHGFTTGERVKGKPQDVNGWNSYEMKEKTDNAIIRKHGFREWFDVIYTPFQPFFGRTIDDIEGTLIRELITEQDKVILELGVGGTKTVPHTIGVDMYLKGESIPTMNNIQSVADIRADVQNELPFDDEGADLIIGRHILEHMIDPVKALKLWVSKLRKGGRIVVALPDQDLNEATLMNIEHVHAYTKESAQNLFSALGLIVENTFDTGNKVSFILVASKP